MPAERLADIKIHPRVLDQIYEDASKAISSLLNGHYKNISEYNGNPNGRVKFELLYLDQQLKLKDLPVPCCAHKGFRPSTISYNYVDGVHPKGSPEARAMWTILKCLDYGCREVSKNRIRDIVKVLDWFCTVYKNSGPIAPNSPDEAMLNDIAKIRSLITQGQMPPFDLTDFPGYANGKGVGLRSNPQKNGNDFIYEAYLCISDCISQRFIPLMPYDIEGDRNIFLYRSLGRFDPLDPPTYLRKLEYVRPDGPKLLTPEEREKAKQLCSEIYKRVEKNNPLPL
jgi:hypothetical protein